MNAHSQDPIVVGVIIEDRGDGGIRIHSNDLRGLHLSGSNRDHVWSMIAPAITALLERNYGMKVAEVRPSKTPEEAFACLPTDVNVHVERQFVIELAAA